jgi:hypothetical protein
VAIGNGLGLVDAEYLERSFPVEWIPILAIAPSTSSAIMPLRNKIVHHPIVLTVFSQAFLAFFRHRAISINFGWSPAI